MDLLHSNFKFNFPNLKFRLNVVNDDSVRLRVIEGLTARAPEWTPSCTESCSGRAGSSLAPGRKPSRRVRVEGQVSEAAEIASWKQGGSEVP